MAGAAVFRQARGDGERLGVQAGAGAVAVGGLADAQQGQSQKPATPGPSAGANSKAKAYGKFCQDQSKKKAEGQKKSDFAKCVNAMAHAAHEDSLTARQACKALSKKHTKGEKGTPFSRCRVGVAQMRKEQDS